MLTYWVGDSLIRKQKRKRRKTLRRIGSFDSASSATKSERHLWQAEMLDIGISSSRMQVSRREGTDEELDVAVKKEEFSDEHESRETAITEESSDHSGLVRVDDQETFTDEPKVRASSSDEVVGVQVGA